MVGRFILLKINQLKTKCGATLFWFQSKRRCRQKAKFLEFDLYVLRSDAGRGSEGAALMLLLPTQGGAVSWHSWRLVGQCQSAFTGKTGDSLAFPVRFGAHPARISTIFARLQCFVRLVAKPRKTRVFSK